MDDVVDLAVLLRPALADVGIGGGVGVEAIDVALPQIEVRPAVGHQLRNGLRRTTGMGDPDRLGQPETAQPIRLPEQGKPIRGEREHAVDGAGDLDLPQRRDQLDRRLPGRDERLGVERVGGRHVVRRAVRTDVAGIDDHRLVTVTADGVVVPPLAEVEILVLMAQDRLPDLTGLAGKLGQRRGPRELVFDRRQRDRHAHHAADARSPDAAADEDPLGFDAAVAGHHGTHPPALGFDADDDRSGLERYAARRSRQRLGGPDWFGDSVRRNVVGAEDHRLVDQIELGSGLGRGQQRGVDPPASCPAQLAMQVRPARGSGCYLETADAIPARLAIMLQRGVELDRLPRKLGHRLRAVGLKDETGRVRGRSPGREEGSLIDDDDVAPAEIRKNVRSRRADDPRTDDDD